MAERGILYMVATPIGNLSDVSPRVLQTLQSVDLIAAEDTRVTAKLLNHFEIQKHLVSCQKYNERERTRQLLDQLAQGKSIAFCSDAGTPVISDPGGYLVDQAMEEGFRVVPICGPSAVVTALSVCGQHCERFCFEGFLPTPKGGRKQRLEELQTEKRTMVFYEAPHKLQRTLEDFCQVFGERTLTICREMTKLHEEIWRTTTMQAAAHYRENTPKGEFVLVLQGAQEAPQEEWTLQEACAAVRKEMEQGTSLSEACKRVAKNTPFSKSELYKQMLEEG